MSTTSIEQLPLQLSVAGAYIMRISLNQLSDPPSGTALCRWDEQFVVWKVWYDETTGKWDAAHGDYFLFGAYAQPDLTQEVRWANETPEDRAWAEARKCYQSRTAAVL